jgi:hypothetical protein
VGSDDIERAEKAICVEVEKAADGATPEQLVQLGQTIAHLKHGPQGGSYASASDSHYQGQTDYHYTTHQGENRERPRAGFGNGDT